MGCWLPTEATSKMPINTEQISVAGTEDWRSEPLAKGRRTVFPPKKIPEQALSSQ